MPQPSGTPENDNGDAPASRPRLYLVATPGHPNYGDELIVAGWLRTLAELAPHADVWVDCPSPGNASVLLDGLHPRARFTDTLWRLCWEAPSEAPWEVAAWVQRGVHNVGQAPRWAAGLELLRCADVVHLLGGGYVHAGWPRHIGLLAGAATAAGISGGRAALTGGSVIPVGPHTAPLLAALLERFDLVDLRDRPSRELLRGHGVDQAAHSCDDAFLRLPEPPENAASGAPEFMLCAQADMLELDRARLAELVLATLRAWKVPPGRLGVVECIPGTDREIYDLVEQQIPGARFYPFAEIWRDGLPVAPGQTWLSTRFHPHLVAAAAGARGVAVPVSPEYYGTKHRSLAALGSGWTVLEAPEQAGSPPGLPTGDGFPAEVTARCREQKQELATRLYGSLPGPSADQEPARRRAWSRRR
jgi:polysaccharide pyruvyl transferase WcaK-like protein